MPKSEQEQKFFDEVWQFWTPKGAETPPCIRCYGPAVTLHEINPRSTERDWLNQPFNSVPICHDCHKWAGENPDSQQVELSSKVSARLQAIQDWKGRNLTYDDIHTDLQS